MKVAFVIVLCMCLYLPCQAQIDSVNVDSVSGDCRGIWPDSLQHPNADTIIIIGDVRIPSGDTLAISPGLLILFDEYYKIEIDSYAVLRAVGTDSSHITFDARDTLNGWSMRFVNSSDSSLLEYCDFNHALATGPGENSKGGAIYISMSNPTIRDCLFENCRALGTGNAGAGIYCTNSSNPIIFNCTFRNNKSTAGGGIYCNSWSNVYIRSCIFENNSAEAIFCNSSSPTIMGNTISQTDRDAICCSEESDAIIVDNTILGNGGSGIRCNQNSNPQILYNRIGLDTASYGGGVYCNANSSPLIQGNTITGNYGRISGGGIFCSSESNPRIIYNVISGDSAAMGGGIYCAYGSNPFIGCNTITENSADNGGGIYLSTSWTDTIFQNTISGNNANFNGGAIFCDNSSPLINNCIIYFNTAPDSTQIYQINGSTPIVQYNDIQGGWHSGEHVIDSLPQFRDPGNDDYHLMSVACGDSMRSPCIDLGDVSILDDTIRCDWGLEGSRSDLGAYGGLGTAVSVGEVTYTPLLYTLSQNYPNPFNAQTSINYSLSKSGPVSLSIYNLLGQKVATISDGFQQAGSHEIIWNAEGFPSGVYFARLESADQSKNIKMILLK